MQKSDHSLSSKFNCVTYKWNSKGYIEAEPPPFPPPTITAITTMVTTITDARVIGSGDQARDDQGNAANE